MTWRPDKYRPIEDTFRRGNVDPDVREELEHHIAMRRDENIAAGMSPADAEREARRRFGDWRRYHEETRRVEQRTMNESKRRDRLAVAGQEIRRAWRALSKARSFSIAAVATLSIGIGATAAIFTILDAVVLRPLPYPAADRLVRIYHPVPKVGPSERWNISEAEFFHFGSAAKRLDAVGVFGQDRVTVMAEGQALPVNATTVSASMLSILGATPILGRLLTVADNERKAAPVVLLAERFWRSQFGGSAGVIGSTIRIEGGDATIVGVIKAGVDLPDWRADLWLPQSLDVTSEARNNHVFRAVGRLRAGETVETASAELRDLLPAYPDRFPSAYDKAFFERSGFTTLVVDWKNDIVGGSSQVLWILFGAVAVVLLIACFNVGNLFVVRSQLTKKEVALRTALGAERRHLIWHHLAESTLVCGGAALFGLGLARIGLGFLVRSLTGDEAVGSVMPRLAEIGVGARGVAFAIGLGAVAALVFGLGPLFAAPAAGQILRQTGRGLTASKRESRLRAGLVVAQITFAVILLAAAGLMLRTFQNLRSVEPGFDPNGVLVVNVALPYGTYQRYPKTNAFYRQLIDRVKAIPAVRHAAIASDVPIGASDGCSTFEYPDRAPEVEVTCIQNAVVGPEYFETLGISVDGRDLNWSDLDSHTGGMLVSDRLAARLWPGANALDRGVNGPNPKSNPPFRVVGVVRDLRWRGLDRDPIELAFFPLEPIPGSWLWSPLVRSVLLVKAPDVDGISLVPAIRQIAKEIDPEVAISNPALMEQVVNASLARVRVMMMLLFLASGAAVFLSVIGLYGVIAYLVNRRTQEIGIRIALGASAGSVRGRVVGQSLQLAGVGVVLGVLGGLAVTRSLAALLFGVSPNDPLTLGVAGATLLAVAAGASLIPAHRATRIDPIQALRAD